MSEVKTYDKLRFFIDGSCPLTLSQLKGLAASAADELQSLEAKANAFDALEGLIKKHGNAQGKWIEIDCYSHWQIDSAEEWKSDKNLGNGPDLQSAINDAVHGGGGE